MIYYLMQEANDYLDKFLSADEIKSFQKQPPKPQMQMAQMVNVNPGIPASAAPGYVKRIAPTIVAPVYISPAPVVPAYRPNVYVAPQTNEESIQE